LFELSQLLGKHVSQLSDVVESGMVSNMVGDRWSWSKTSTVDVNFQKSAVGVCRHHHQHHHVVNALPRGFSLLGSVRPNPRNAGL
jgi:hypothetical protein